MHCASTGTEKKSRQPSLSSSKNKINTLEAFLTVWHFFYDQIFLLTLFFSWVALTRYQNPLSCIFSCTWSNFYIFGEWMPFLFPQTRRNVAGSQNGVFIHFSPFSIQASRGVFTWKRANYDHFQHTNDSCTSESHSRSDVPPAYKGMLISSLWGVQPVVLRFNSPRLLQRLFFFLLLPCLR